MISQPIFNANVLHQKAFIQPVSKEQAKQKKLLKRTQSQRISTIKITPKKADLKAKPKIYGTEYDHFFMNSVDITEKPRKKVNDTTLVEKELENEETQPDSTDFLNVAEFADLKGIYNDQSFGELVIQFPNPDNRSYLQRPVTIQECEHVFQNILCIDSLNGISKMEMNQQREAFFRGFLQLDDYVDPEPSDLKKKRELEEENSKRKHSKKYQEFFEKYRNIDDNQLFFKELQHLPVKDLSKYKDERKKYCQGRFLYQKFTEDRRDWDWICMGTRPKDFLTLVRLTVMTKLSRDAHLHVRSFLSEDGKYINVVLKADRKAVEEQSHGMEIKKQYDLGFADLFSLEPIDNEFRPLRLKTYLKDDEFIQSVKDHLEQIKQEDQKKKKENKSAARIEGRVSKVLQEAQKLNDFELRLNLIYKQQNLDVELEKVAKKLKMKIPKVQEELQDERSVSRETWNAYYVYIEYISSLLKRVEGFEKYEEVSDSLPFLYKLIFLQAVHDINKTHQKLYGSFFKKKIKILKTIWDELKVSPIPPYGTYSTHRKDIWRKYQINERGQRSVFTNTDIITISHQMILSHIDIMALIQSGLAVSYMALHDPYQLMGVSKSPLFKPLIDMNLMQLQGEEEKKEGYRRLQDLLKALESGAEPEDFDSECLLDKAVFNCMTPWVLPILSIKDYFGQKIALFFKFESFMTKQLFNIALLSIIFEFVINHAPVKSRKAFEIMLALIIVSWSTIFVRKWKREETVFQMFTGSDPEHHSNEELERPAFQGKYRRSIVNDSLNEEYQTKFQSTVRLIFSFFITLLIICLVILTILSIQLLKSYLKTVSDEPFVYNTVPSLINSIQIKIFNAIYYPLGNILNDFENHKYVSSYENSLISKNFIFIFVNTFLSLFIISFLDPMLPSWNVCKQETENDCFAMLQTQMISIFLVNIALGIPEMVMPYIQYRLRSERQVDETPTLHEFYEIDSYIETQTLMEPYQTNAEVDGTVGDYLFLVVLFSFLTLFGLAFPLGYFIAYINLAFQIYIDKVKIFKLCQRPIPTNAMNIGAWMLALEVVNFLSAFANSALIVFPADSIPEGADKIKSFIILIIFFLMTQYASKFLYPPVPIQTEVLRARHKSALQRVSRFSGGGASAKPYKPGKVRQKIDGVDYTNAQFQVTDEHLVLGANVRVMETKR